MADVNGGSTYLLKDPPGGGIISDPSSTTTYIDAAETLVIWLGGLSANANYPLTGPGGPLAIDTTTTLYLNPALRRETALFDFKEERLKDYDGDSLYEYYPPSGSNVPYVYFDGRSYDSAWADYSMAQGVGAVCPYVSNAAAGTYMNAQKCQILCAGLDENFGEYTLAAGNSGVPADRKQFPTGAADSTANVSQYTEEDLDNIGSFSGGTFGDKMPQ